MHITVQFDNVYDNGHHIHVEVLLVPKPTSEDVADAFRDWSDDHIFPHTGDGNATTKEASYFALIVDAPDFPALLNHEFCWGA